MNRRVFSALVGIAVAVPSASVQFAVLVHGRPPSLSSLPWLGIANLVLLAGLVAVAADYPLAGRAGRAALIGLGVALVMPGPTALDSVVMLAAPGWDAGTWLVILMPYVLLLGMLALAEAGLYLLATRARTTPR
jgi:hypothetical protein